MRFTILTDPISKTFNRGGQDIFLLRINKCVKYPKTNHTKPYLKIMKLKFIQILTILVSTIFPLFILSENAVAGNIEGRIMDNFTHEKIVGAVVTVENHKSHVAVTDVDGKYRIDNIPEGKYTILVTSLGYENSSSQEVTITSADQTLTVNISMKSKSIEIGEVQVTGAASKESDAGARESEKVASNVINVISARAIEMLPDLNVADVMQRVSGVSMLKNGSGNNDKAEIRGMPPRFSETLINGTLVPGTGESSSSVSLDIFPSVFVGRIVVTKAPTPDMIGSGLGGIVDIVMKDAPDTAILAVDISTGYSQYLLQNGFYTFDYQVVNDKNPAQIHGPEYITSPSDFPTANLVLQHIQAPPDLLGSISYGNRFFHKRLGLLIAGTYQNSYQEKINNWYVTYPTVTNVLDTSDKETAKICNQYNRMGAIVRLDYRFNKNHQISVYNNYFSLVEIRTRNERDTSYEINWGRVYDNQFTNLDKSYLENLAIQGKHVLSDKLDLDWSLIYSLGGGISPDLVTVAYNRIIHPTLQATYLNYDNTVDRYWQWNTNEQKSAYLNINYKPLLFNHLFEFKLGGMAIDKYSLNNENDYFLDFTNTIKYPNPNVQYIWSHNLLNAVNTQQLQGDAIDNPANFRAFEDIYAGYAMVTSSFGKLKVVGGVRVEKTKLSDSHRGLLSGQDTTQFAGQGYTDILPGLYLNYTFDQKQNLRLSVYTAINRPDLTEVVPYESRSVNGNTYGNANLSHTTGTCFDARYEIYPSSEEVITGGIFYKYLKNPIEETMNGNGDTHFDNAPNCTNFGFEFVGIKYFGNVGIDVNYTFTKSKISSPYLWNDTAAGKTYTRIETRPLAGQSTHLINTALIYRDKKIGLKCQLTYTFQGKNLENVGSSYGADSYQLNYNDLGFSLDQRLSKKMHLYVKCSNLLNESLKFQTASGINTQQLTSSRSFLIGFKFNL